MVAPQGRSALRKALVTFLAEERGTPLLRQLLAEQQAELAYGDQQLAAGTTHIEQKCARQPLCQRLQTIPGIGPLSAFTLWVKLGLGTRINMGAMWPPL